MNENTNDGLKPAKEFKPQEFMPTERSCIKCKGKDFYINGMCKPCHEEQITGDRVDHYVAMLTKLPSKLRELKMVDLEKTPDLIKIKYSLRNGADNKKSVYLHGPVGNGKTSLMALLFKYQARKGIFVDWTNVPELMESIRRGYGKNDDIISRLISTGTAGTLFLDDLGAERVKKDAEISFVEEQLYRLINGLYERNGHVMIISNKKPSEIAEQVGDRIVSRLVEMCVQVENTLPDYRLKNVRK